MLDKERLKYVTGWKLYFELGDVCSLFVKAQSVVKFTRVSRTIACTTVHSSRDADVLIPVETVI